MIKSELIARIAATNAHLFHRDVEKIVNVVFDEIVDALSRGERVELRGFGAFTVKHRTARQGRNPRTGDSVSVDEKFVPFFKTGKELREKLNEPVAKPAKAAARAVAVAPTVATPDTGPARIPARAPVRPAVAGTGRDKAGRT